MRSDSLLFLLHPHFPAPAVMQHDGLMANVLPPPTRKPSWHSLNTTTGRIRDRKARRTARQRWKTEGKPDGRMCVRHRDVPFVPHDVPWPGCRKVQAFPAHCTSEEITSVVSCHSSNHLFSRKTSAVWKSLLSGLSVRQCFQWEMNNCINLLDVEKR